MMLNFWCHGGEFLLNFYYNQSQGMWNPQLSPFLLKEGNTWT
jgi:hypothetical protein